MPLDGTWTRPLGTLMRLAVILVGADRSWSKSWDRGRRNCASRSTTESQKQSSRWITPWSVRRAAPGRLDCRCRRFASCSRLRSDARTRVATESSAIGMGRTTRTRSPSDAVGAGSHLHECQASGQIVQPSLNWAVGISHQRARRPDRVFNALCGRPRTAAVAASHCRTALAGRGHG